ncbi:MAG: hypothetical protein WCO78_02540 [Candidatus Roizmanbacteria bacterium]
MSDSPHVYSDQSYWDYLSLTQQDLVREGGYIYQEIFSNSKYNFKDYAFVVFPFAKAYEGFLKKVFLDIGYITQKDYVSTHLRLGRLLSPDTFYKTREQSLYAKIEEEFSAELASEIWHAWKYCRNELFHYYPHNEKSTSLIEAKEKITEISTAMSKIYTRMIQQNR